MLISQLDERSTWTESLIAKSLTLNIPIEFMPQRNKETSWMMRFFIKCEPKSQEDFFTCALSSDWTRKNRDNHDLERCLVFSLLCMQHDPIVRKWKSDAFFLRLATSCRFPVAKATSVIYYLFGSYYGKTFSIDSHFCIFSQSLFSFFTLPPPCLCLFAVITCLVSFSDTSYLNLKN